MKKLNLLMLFLIVGLSSAYGKDKSEDKKNKAVAPRKPAAEDCLKRETIFGKIIAICGDRNVVFAGTQKMNILGGEYVKPVFELPYCNGGNRVELSTHAHSEGFRFQLVEPEVLKYGKDGKPALSQQITVENAWGKLTMSTAQSDGKVTETPCTRYVDTRTNIEYLH